MYSLEEIRHVNSLTPVNTGRIVGHPDVKGQTWKVAFGRESASGRVAMLTRSGDTSRAVSSDYGVVFWQSGRILLVNHSTSRPLHFRRWPEVAPQRIGRRQSTNDTPKPVQLMPGWWWITNAAEDEEGHPTEQTAWLLVEVAVEGLTRQSHPTKGPTGTHGHVGPEIKQFGDEEVKALVAFFRDFFDLPPRPRPRKLTAASVKTMYSEANDGVNAYNRLLTASGAKSLEETYIQYKSTSGELTFDAVHKFVVSHPKWFDR